MSRILPAKPRLPDAAAPAWEAFLPALVGLGALVPIFLLLGLNPLSALAGLVQGSLGGREELTNTFLKFCPLLLTGLAVLLSFRAGFLNIGAEGQFMAGAMGAAAWAKMLGPEPRSGPWWLGALLAGLAAGSFWCYVAAWMRVRRAVPDVIGTLMLNFLALYGLSWAVHGPLQEAVGAYPQTDAFGPGLLLPRWAWGRLHLMVFLAPPLAAATGFWLQRSSLGFQIRAVGAGPRVARASGLPVDALVRLASILAGGFCGLAGAVEALGVSGRVYEGFSAGYGYTAIAVALLARLNPWALFPSAFFFAAMASGAGWMQRSLGLPSVFLYIVQALVIVSTLLLGRRSD